MGYPENRRVYIFVQLRWRGQRRIWRIGKHHVACRLCSIYQNICFITYALYIETIHIRSDPSHCFNASKKCQRQTLCPSNRHVYDWNYETPIILGQAASLPLNSIFTYPAIGRRKTVGMFYKHLIYDNNVIGAQRISTDNIEEDFVAVRVNSFCKMVVKVGNKAIIRRNNLPPISQNVCIDPT